MVILPAGALRLWLLSEISGSAGALKTATSADNNHYSALHKKFNV
jgi:hypothetical protein